MDAGQAILKPRVLFVQVCQNKWRCEGENIKAGVICPAMCTVQSTAGSATLALGAGRRDVSSGEFLDSPEGQDTKQLLVD